METIRWSADGKSFIISNTEKFIRILPKYFKTKNYSSFVRQLNMYSGLKNDDAAWEVDMEKNPMPDSRKSE